jgi:hypothetical protein
MKKEEENRITVGDLVKQLSVFDQSKELFFGGLEFYRLKDRGEHVQVEFSETVYRDNTGKIVIENN